MRPEETELFRQLEEKNVRLERIEWAACRDWLNQNEWKINVLSDYPQGEIKFAVRRGFERIEVSGKSDLEVMAKAMLEITRRESFR